MYTTYTVCSMLVEMQRTPKLHLYILYNVDTTVHERESAAKM